MKARRTGLVVEWVVEEDARRILLSSPPGTGCERSIIVSCRSDGTRPGAWDGAFPSSRSQSGMRAGDDDRQRRRSDGTRPGAWDGAFPSAPNQGCEQDTTTSETTERRHEAGRLGCSLPLLSLPVRDESRRRRPQRRRSDGTRPGAWDVAFPSSLFQSGMRAGDDDDSTTRIRAGRTT